MYQGNYVELQILFEWIKDPNSQRECSLVVRQQAAQ